MKRPKMRLFEKLMKKLGLKLDSLTFGGILVESSPTKYNWQCYIYTAQIEWLEPPFCDEGVLEWKTFADLSEIPTPPTDWMIYHYLKENRRFVFNAIYNESIELIEMVEELEGKKVI